MGSNPISSGTEVERAGEITWEKEPLGGVPRRTEEHDLLVWLGAESLFLVLGGVYSEEHLTERGPSSPSRFVEQAPPLLGKVGRYSMKKTHFRKVVQVAQLVRAKDWKSLCQWFESTSKRAKGKKGT